jgi:hypothetical protein
MAFVEFDGALDAPAETTGAPKFIPFDGKLDEPSKPDLRLVPFDGKLDAPADPIEPSYVDPMTGIDPSGATAEKTANAAPPSVMDRWNGKITDPAVAAQVQANNDRTDVSKVGFAQASKNKLEDDANRARIADLAAQGQATNAETPLQKLGRSFREDADTTISQNVKGVIGENIGPKAADFAGDIDSGVLTTAGGTLSHIGRKIGADWATQLGDAMSAAGQRTAVKDPTLADKVVGGFASLATFYIPGVGVASGAEALAVLAPTMARYMGAGTMAGLGAASAADTTYKEMLAKGATEKQAAEKADDVFLRNAAIMSVADKIGLFGEFKSLTGRVASSAATFGAQNAAMTAIGNNAAGRPTSEGVGESVFIGAVTGGPLGAIHHANTPTAAKALADTLNHGELGRYDVDAAARARLDPQNYDSATITPQETVKPTVADIAKATSVDEAIAAAQASLPEIKPVETNVNDTAAQLQAIRPLPEVAKPVPEPVRPPAEIERINEDNKAIGEALRGHQDAVVEPDGAVSFRGARIEPIAKEALPDHSVAGESELSRQQAEAIGKLLELRGQKLVVYGDHPNLPDGFVDPANSSRLFLSSKTTRGADIVAGHELNHTMGRTAPEAYKAYLDTVREELATGAMEDARAQHKSAMSDDAIHREIGADIAGNAMRDPAFVSKVMDKMRARMGDEAAQPIAKKLIDTLGKTIARIKELVKGGMFRNKAEGLDVAKAYINNLERVHDALADVYAQHFAESHIKNDVVPVEPEAVPTVNKPVEAQRLKPPVVDTPAGNKRQATIDALLGMKSSELRDMAENHQRSYMRNAAADIIGQRDAETRLKRSKAATARHNDTHVDPATESMAQAIVKLGGVHREGAKINLRLTPEELKATAGIKPIFAKNGMRMDEMGAHLAELGYVHMDENGKYDRQDFHDKLAEVASGNEVHTPEAMMRRAQESHEHAMDEVGARSDMEYHQVEQDVDLAEQRLKAHEADILLDPDLDAGIRTNHLSDEAIDELFGLGKPETTRGSDQANTAGTARNGLARDAQAGEGRGGEQGFLHAESIDEAKARLAEEEHSAKVARSVEERADHEARAARIKQEIDQRQDSSAENFRLGQSAEDGLSGQEPLFSEKRGDALKEEYKWDRVHETENGPIFINKKFTFMPTHVDNTFDAKWHLGGRAHPDSNAHHYSVFGADGQKVADLSLEMLHGKIEKLLYLGVDPRLQGKGVGRDIIGSLVANESHLPEHEGYGTGYDDLLKSTPKYLKIFDVLSQSEKFWQKTGAEAPNVDGHSQTNWSSFNREQSRRSRETDQRQGNADAGISRTVQQGDGNPEKPLLSEKREVEKQPAFYSQLARSIEQVPAKIDNGPATQWKLWLQSNAGKLGIKSEEIKWSGITDYLDLMGKQKVSKEQIGEYLAQNGVKVTEVEKASNGAFPNVYVKEIGDSGMFGVFNKDTDNQIGGHFESESAALSAADEHTANAEVGTKYNNYQLPGGKNYRELLLTLPKAGPIVSAKFDSLGGKVISTRKYQEDYKTTHWDEPNILAHIRFNERTDADGKRVLFLEEIQSDWQQAKRAGKDVPDAPFIGANDPKPVVSLALKRMIRYAAEHGYDKVAFVNGEQSAARYDLSKQISRVYFDDNSSGGIGKPKMDGELGSGTLHAYDLNGKEVISKYVSPDKIEEYIGKDAAKKLTEQQPKEASSAGFGVRRRELSGLDLKVGGEGMKAFYDNIVPQVANDVLKKLGGGKVGDVQIQHDKFTVTRPDLDFGKDFQTKAEADAYAEKHNGTVHAATIRSQSGFEITPAMREQAMQGQPLFSEKRTEEPVDHFANGAKSNLPGDGMISHATNSLSDLIDAGMNKARLYEAIAPMSEGTQATRAIAQRHINLERKAQYQWSEIDKQLTKDFTPAQRKNMWEAADEENDLRREGKTATDRGINRLPEQERKVMDALHGYATELWQRAKDSGLVSADAEGVHYWTPRMMAKVDEDGNLSRPSEGQQATGDGMGRNITTAAGSAKLRKYETAAETEAAMKAKGGELVRDIRTMPMAMAKMERAIAGRELINQIKELGKATGKDLVAEHAAPDFFTLDHPAFKTFKPRMVEEDGKMVPALDQNGDIIFDKVPIYISNEFKGPLQAIMTTSKHPAYTGYMLLKSKSMSVIMYSPLIHNQVILGRALAYGGIKTPMLYFTGHVAKGDQAFMQKMIEGGMVPSGAHNTMLDVGDIAEGRLGKEGGWLDPNESWIGLSAKAIGNKIHDGLGTAIKEGKYGIDAAGNLWHNKLLWDRIGDLQAGIAKDVYTKLKAQGLDENAAVTVAAHIANRYAGAIGRENMSQLAHVVANITLFSKSFNAGNVGTVKDVFYGLPAGLKAQLLENSNAKSAIMAMQFAKHKARVGLVRDIAYAIVLTSMAQSWFKRDKDADWGADSVYKGWDEYKQRAMDMWMHAKDNPLDLGSYNPQRLSSTWNNEPGKQDRIDLGAQDSGRHEYMRLPTGKVYEDILGWALHPGDTFDNKMSPMLKAALGLKTGAKDKYGTPISDPNAPMLKRAAQVAEFLVGTAIPLDQIKAAKDIATGHGTELDKDKLRGNFTGLSISQGHPNGPEAGVAAEVENRITASKRFAMEEAKRSLKYGDEDGAWKTLENAGLTPKEINSIIRRIESPRDSLSKTQNKHFNQHANDEERERMDRLSR